MAATKKLRGRSRGKAARPARKPGPPAAPREELGGGDAGEEVATLDAKRYYRIGEVARLTGVKPYVLRYWETEFRWMSPAKSRSQQRLYRKRDIEVILLIKRLLYAERFTIAGARKKLQELGVSRALDAPQLDLALGADPREQLRRIRGQLLELRATLA